jgi:hypothetical protein
MADHPSDTLSAYVDGELAAEAAGQIDAHLGSCAECRATVGDLEALRRKAAALAGTGAMPAHDLWPGIAARLESREAVAPPVSLAWYRRRWTVGIGELAVAASLIAALSAAALWRGTPQAAPTGIEVVPVIAQVEPVDAPDMGVARVGFSDAQFNAAVNDLERVLREQRDQLNPRTVLVLERNLRVIDDAIVEARQALAADPANTLLNAHLADARRRKLDLLRRAALITEGD